MYSRFGYRIQEVQEGTDGDDILGGWGGNDLFIGGPGRDFMVGASAFDIVDYSRSAEGVHVRLLAGGGDAEGDRYGSIEGITQA